MPNCGFFVRELVTLQPIAHAGHGIRYIPCGLYVGNYILHVQIDMALEVFFEFFKLFG